jgi:hypothetical protein
MKTLRLIFALSFLSALASATVGTWTLYETTTQSSDGSSLIVPQPFP